MDPVAVAVPSIEVAAQPVAKPRPRVVNGHTYTPTQAREAEHRIREAWLQAGHGLQTGPLRATVVVVLRRPAAHFGTGRNGGSVRAAAPTWPTTRPDLDNYVKTVLDGLNGVAYADDGAVVELLARKQFGELAKWEISVEPLSC